MPNRNERAGKQREYPVIFRCGSCIESFKELNWIGEITDREERKLCPLCIYRSVGKPYVYWPKGIRPPHVPRWAYEETPGVKPLEGQIEEALAAKRRADAYEARRQRAGLPDTRPSGGGERARASRRAG